jgi:hypothetical protein
LPYKSLFLDGLISTALKENKIDEALEQVAEYSMALNMAKKMTSEKDTLILSMSDLGNSLNFDTVKVSFGSFSKYLSIKKQLIQFCQKNAPKIMNHNLTY